MTIIIHGIPGSPYVRMPILACEEKGVPWQLARPPQRRPRERDDTETERRVTQSLDHCREVAARTTAKRRSMVGQLGVSWRLISSLSVSMVRLRTAVGIAAIRSK